MDTKHYLLFEFFKNIKKIRIVIDYDKRNKSLKMANMNSFDEPMAQSVHHAAFVNDLKKRTAAQSDGPFSKRVEFSENKLVCFLIQ